MAVDRRFKRNGDDQTADFIGCVAFGRNAEFAEKYFRQGLKVVVTGRIQTGSYNEQRWTEGIYNRRCSGRNRNLLRAKLQVMPTREVFPCRWFQQAPAPTPAADAGDGFMNIPDGIDEELPFN